MRFILLVLNLEAFMVEMSFCLLFLFQFLGTLFCISCVLGVHPFSDFFFYDKVFSCLSQNIRGIGTATGT